MTPLWLALCAVQVPIDEATLLVRQDTVPVAREAFRLSETRGGGGGWTLATTIRFDRSRPVLVLDPVIEIRPDSSVATLEYTVADPRGPVRIVGQAARGRFVVRLLGRRTEQAREFAAPHRTAVLDDSVFALYLPLAWQARPGAVAVTVIFPRARRRELVTVTDEGTGRTILSRDSVSLRHITVIGGESHLVHVWLGGDGRLAKVEIPSRGFVAEREATP